MADETCALCDGTGRFTAVIGPEYGACPGCTDPDPAPDQRPAFELVSATLWSVLVAFRPQPDVQPAHVELQLVTATPSGEEVYPLAIARARELSPGATELMVVTVQRRGDVVGTVARRPRRPS